MKEHLELKGGETIEIPEEETSQEIKGEALGGANNEVKSEKSIFDQLQEPVEAPKEDFESDTLEDALGYSSEKSYKGGALENGFEDVEEEDMEGLFADHQLMAELGVEVIDLAFTYGAMAIAGEKDEEPFKVSAQRRNRLKKPLAMLLKNREAKVKPEVMVIVIVLSVYAPTIYKAVKMKMEKDKAKKKQKENTAYVQNAEEPSRMDAIRFRNRMKDAKKESAPSTPPPSSSKAIYAHLPLKEKYKKAYLMKEAGAKHKEIMEALDIGESTSYSYVKKGEEVVKKEGK